MLYRNYKKYGDEAVEFIGECGREIEQFLAEPLKVCKVINDFMVRYVN